MLLTVSSSFSFLHGPPSPLIATRPCPSANPFELYSRIASARSPSFLLESGTGDGAMGRYSYFGSDPYQTLTGTADQFVQRSTLGHTESGLGPYQQLIHLVGSQRIDRPPGSPPFFGGAVGYFSYDLARQFERLPSLAHHDNTCPDLEFAFFDVVGAVDHELGDLVLMFCPSLERFLGEPRDKLFREGTDRLAAFEAQLSRSVAAESRSEELERFTFTPDQSRSTYIQSVRRCQEYIASGDIYQANLSHRFTVSCNALTQESLQTDLSVYRRLRTLNPSPFSGLLRFDGIRLISSSPERLVRLDGRRADTRPIAGTRPRGKTMTADQELATELRANTKERAEHIMLVDLERNDLGRVCRYGSVRVDELMTLEQYSHVNHLVSQVSGTLRAHVTGFDLLKAMFPGGTITGVPKIRCMEIIEELEPVRRGPYTGSMGYFSLSGDLDFNIVIRTLVVMNGVASLQVGAGIVADSDPAREYEETIHKAQAFFSAFS